jgi:hypothetical protein
MIGIALGLLIGVITGTAFLLLVLTAKFTDAKAIISVVAEILAIPTFWLGGPWLTTTLMQQVDLNLILPSYLASLACTFLAAALYPLVRLVIRTGNAMANAGGTNG